MCLDVPMSMAYMWRSKTTCGSSLLLPGGFQESNSGISDYPVSATCTFSN